MVVVDTDCHTQSYWYKPIEILMNQIYRHGVDKAVPVQINKQFDNSYAIECMRRFPDHFSVATVGTANKNSPNRLE